MSKSAGTQRNPQPINDSIPALAALYQGEKADASTILGAAMAMMGVAVAYLAWVVPFVSTIIEGNIPKLLLLLLPVPLWLIAAFHSLMALNAMSHGISIRIIEDALFRASAFGTTIRRDMVGSASGDKIMDITQSGLSHRITTVFVYGGVALLVILFTCYCLLVAKKSVSAKYFWIATSCYLLVFFMVAASWNRGIRLINHGRSELHR